MREIRDEGDEREQVLPESRVHLQDARLSLGQRTRLEKNHVREADLADVVEQEAVSQVRFRGQLSVDYAGQPG